MSFYTHFFRRISGHSAILPAATSKTKVAVKQASFVPAIIKETGVEILAPTTVEQAYTRMTTFPPEFRDEAYKRYVKNEGQSEPLSSTIVLSLIQRGLADQDGIMYKLVYYTFEKYMRYDWDKADYTVLELPESLKDTRPRSSFK